MPSKAFIQSWRDDIGAFLEEPGANVLALRTEPETAGLGARILASFEREAARRVVVLASSIPFQAAASWYAAMAEAITEDLGRHGDELRTGGIEVAAIERFSPEPSPLSPELRFADYIERIQRVLGGHARRLMVALRPSAVSDTALFQASIEALSAATGSSRVKYVVVDQRTEPWLQTARTVVERLAEAPLGRDPRSLLGAFLGSPACRVLLAQRGPGAAALHDLVADEEDRRVLRIAQPFQHLHGFYDAAEEALVGLLGQGQGAGGASIRPDPRPTSLVEGRFAVFAEKVAAAVVPEGKLVVLIEVGVAAQLPLLRASVERLAGAASSPRVKYLFVHETAEPGLKGSTGRPSGIVTRELVATAGDAERGLEEAVADPVTGAEERIRFLCVLSGFATARKDYQKAYALCTKALEQGRKLGAPGEQAIAWMALGGAFFQERQLRPARDAFAHATARAVEGKNPMLAAQALLQAGHAHFLLGEQPAAAECYRVGAATFGRIGHVLGEAQALLFLGESHRRAGARAEAEVVMAKALERLESANELLEAATRPGRIECLARLARLYDEMGRGKEGKELRRRSRELGGDGEVRDLV